MKSVLFGLLSFSFDATGIGASRRNSCSSAMCLPRAHRHLHHLHHLHRHSIVAENSRSNTTAHIHYSGYDAAPVATASAGYGGYHRNGTSTYHSPHNHGEKYPYIDRNTDASLGLPHCCHAEIQVHEHNVFVRALLCLVRNTTGYRGARLVIPSL